MKDIMEDLKYDLEQVKLKITRERALDYFYFGMICLSIYLVGIAIDIEKLFIKAKNLLWNASLLMASFMIPFALSQFFKQNLWQYIGYLIMWLMVVFSKPNNYKTDGKVSFIGLLPLILLFFYIHLFKTTEQGIVTNILGYTLVGCSIYFFLFFCKVINPRKKKKNPSYIFSYITWRYRVINILLNIFKLVGKKIIGG